MNNWIIHVKNYALENSIPYKQALIEGKHSYRNSKLLSGKGNSNRKPRIYITNDELEQYRRYQNLNDQNIAVQREQKRKEKKIKKHYSFSQEMKEEE